MIFTYSLKTTLLLKYNYRKNILNSIKNKDLVAVNCKGPFRTDAANFKNSFLIAELHNFIALFQNMLGVKS